MGQNFHKIEAVRLEGGDTPPPQAVSLTAFFPFFLTPSLSEKVSKAATSPRQSHKAALQVKSVGKFSARQGF